MRLLPSILLPISLQENIQTISTADFFKLPLQAGVRPQQQLEDFRRTPSFDYKGAFFGLTFSGGGTSVCAPQSGHLSGWPT